MKQWKIDIFAWNDVLLHKHASNKTFFIYGAKQTNMIYRLLFLDVTCELITEASERIHFLLCTLNNVGYTVKLNMYVFKSYLNSYNSVLLSLDRSRWLCISLKSIWEQTATQRHSICRVTVCSQLLSSRCQSVSLTPSLCRAPANNVCSLFSYLFFSSPSGSHTVCISTNAARTRNMQLGKS